MVDIKKADGTDRSRRVATKFKSYNAPELFAATPPKESLKYVSRRAAQEDNYLRRVDMTRACFYAEAIRNMSSFQPKS